MRFTLQTFAVLTLTAFPHVAWCGDTEVSIRGDMFLIDGKPTYAGRTWQGHKVEGLMLNSRMVQAIWDDRNPETRSLWKYPDTNSWDPDRNTREFLAALAEYRNHGLLAVSLNMQEGNPHGYQNDQPWRSSGYTDDGVPRPEYLVRLGKILDRTDQLGMVVILGLFYFGQDQTLKGEKEILHATDAMADWVLGHGYRNVLIEADNETNVAKYDHEILKPARIHELIERVKSHTQNGRRLLVSTSYGGGAIPRENVVRAADFLLIHGNGVTDPEKIAEMVRKTRAVAGYHPMPILFNEDDHFNFEKPLNNFVAAIGEYASWGYFDPGAGNYKDGYQYPPVNWGINTETKRAFFFKVKEITGR